jgi:hypothetical protein
LPLVPLGESVTKDGSQSEGKIQKLIRIAAGNISLGSSESFIKHIKRAVFI